MSYITKHHTEQEWESDGSEHSWVHLLKSRNSICVDNSLKCLVEFVAMDFGRWRNTHLVSDAPVLEQVMAFGLDLVEELLNVLRVEGCPEESHREVILFTHA